MIKETETDVIIVGAGHNGLVAAVLLARAGLSVCIVEASGVPGGACRTEYPFRVAPRLGASTGAYLLGLMPPELIGKLGITIPTIRRDPHYFLPTTQSRYLLFGSDQVELRKQFQTFFSERDWQANTALQEELAALREDIAPSYLLAPMSVDETALQFVRPVLREAFTGLCRGSVLEYLRRFGFESPLLQAMYAVTDGLSGLSAGIDEPGSGANFLVHNMCRLPGSDGTWMLVKGGMGGISTALSTAATAAGASIYTDCEVTQIDIRGGKGCGVFLADGTRIGASQVVLNTDPFSARALIGETYLTAEYQEYLKSISRPGMTMKVNLCLSALPKFTCLLQDRGQFGTTMHILPEGDDVLDKLISSFHDAQAGKLPDFPAIEWYTHTVLDPSLADGSGAHNGALFVQGVPNAISTSTWEREEEGYVKHLLSVCDRFAPGTTALVKETLTFTPPKIESYFRISRGHIHHVDNSFVFDKRHPVRGPLPGLYSASAGCHPAGSVIGAAGHNAAMAVLADRGTAASQ